MAKKKQLSGYEPAVYVKFVDARLLEGMETPEEILWNFSAALLAVVEEDKRFQQQDYGSGPFAEKEKSTKKAKSAAAGGK